MNDEGSLCCIRQHACLFKLSLCSYVCVNCLYDCFVLFSTFELSSQLSDTTVTNANSQRGSSASTDIQTVPATVDKSTQTESTPSGQDSAQDRVPLHGRVQSLQLEDALVEGPSVSEGNRAKLHRVPGMEEEDEEPEEDEGGGRGEQEKDLTWASSVEEPIQPTTIRGLQREDLLDGSCSPEDPGSASASFKSSDQNLSCRSGPLSPIHEREKALCVVLPHCRVLYNLNHLSLIVD